MKIRAVVLDLTGDAMDWLNMHGNEEHLELCEILTLDDDSPIPVWDLNKYDNWDILLVFERGVNDRVKQLLKHIGIEDSRIIYPLDEADGSLYDNKAVVSYIFDDYIGKLLDYVSARKSGKYALISADNLTYVNVSTDNVILPEMIRTGRNWVYDDMELFYRLSHEYFEFNDAQNIFCDIGANIGTTCIYFKKKLDNKVRIMAFEPSSENYKLLKINMELNDVEVSEYMLFDLGLSDRKENAILHYSAYNPGGSSVANDCSDQTENVRMIPFDDHLREYGISPENIKYMWIDIEGHEARFLAGAEKTLERINVPVFMEFIPRLYLGREHEFELLMREIEKHFKYFICRDEIDKGKQSVNRLRMEQDNCELSWDLFLLKE